MTLATLRRQTLRKPTVYVLGPTACEFSVNGHHKSHLDLLRRHTDKDRERSRKQRGSISWTLPMASGCRLWGRDL